MGVEDWHAVLRADLDSVFNMSKQAIEPMMTQRWGRIVNISSVNGQQGAFGQANYAAAKAGMHGFTKALALETARHGITVNTVSPGYLRTRMVESVPDEVMRDRILPQIPVGRLGEPAEVAGLVAYLASDEASFITGANLAINGGQHMY
jgi:acetoacetyl-CoA reductase